MSITTEMWKRNPTCVTDSQLFHLLTYTPCRLWQDRKYLTNCRPLTSRADSHYVDSLFNSHGGFVVVAFRFPAVSTGCHSGNSWRAAQWVVNNTSKRRIELQPDQNVLWYDFTMCNEALIPPTEHLGAFEGPCVLTVCISHIGNCQLRVR